jgi:hypothetical protein
MHIHLHRIETEKEKIELFNLQFIDRKSFLSIFKVLTGERLNNDELFVIENMRKKMNDALQNSLKYEAEANQANQVNQTDQVQPIAQEENKQP